jgi:hypothetical protein
MKRPLWMVSASLAGAAVALWGSSRLAWATETRSRPGTDATSVVTRTGADVRPLVPLAVLALAGVAAAVAIGGWPRRVLGVVLVAAGLTAAWFGFVTVPGDSGFLWGHALSVLGGLLLTAAGVLLAWLSDRLPRLGQSYQRTNAERRSDDPDEEMWRALSLGKDPTTDDHRP